MSVVGFDLGNHTSYVGIARAGGLEVLTNEYSERHNPSYVSLNGCERFAGQAAKQQEIHNLKNTFSNFKRLMGRSISDPLVQRELQFLPFNVVSDGGDRILIKGMYDGSETLLLPQQLYAMMLSKLMRITQADTGQRAIDCVLSMPLYATDLERRAVKEAAQIAGLNCMRIMNDSAAVALNYCMYKPDLPEEKESPVNVVFVDMGYASLQVAIVAIQKTKCKTIGVSFDSCLGGRDFDNVLVDFCMDDVRKRFNGFSVDRKSRSGVRLLVQCERVKKMMSTMSMPVPIDVECLIDGNDYHNSVSRDQFEELASDLFSRARNVLSDALRNSGLDVAEIGAVEIVGGSTRVPGIKAVIKDVFGREPSTTLNADEAVARGCTLMCAILSPTFRVRQVQIADLQPYPITISWKSQDSDDTEREVFTAQDNFPLTKMIRVNKPSRSTMEIEARYALPNNIPFSEPRIGYFTVDGMKGDLKDLTKLKFRVRINSDGIFEMKQPQLFEPVEQVPEEEESIQEQPQEQASSTPDQSKSSPESEGAVLEPKSPDKSADQTSTQTNDEPRTIPIEVKGKGDKARPPPKPASKTIDLSLVSKIKQLTRDQLIAFHDMEVNMLDVDRREKEKADVRNAIEEFIYDMRDKLSDSYAHFATNDQKAAILQKLDANEDWLLNSADCRTEKSEYERRLNALREMCAPIVKRYREHGERPGAVKLLEKALQDIIVTYNLWYNGDEHYSHLTKEEMMKVHTCLQNGKQLLDKVLEETSKSTPSSLYLDFKYSVSEIEKAKSTMESVCLPILRRPKPAPPVPTKKSSSGKDDKHGTPGTAAQNTNSSAAAAAEPEEGAERNAGADQQAGMCDDANLDVE